MAYHVGNNNARSIAMMVQENSDPKKKELLKFYVDPEYRPVPNGPLVQSLPPPPPPMALIAVV